MTNYLYYKKQGLVLDILGKEGHKEFLIQSSKILKKKKIEEYVEGMDTIQNEIRRCIEKGTLRDKHALHRLHRGTMIYFAQLELVGVLMVIRLRNDFQPYHWTSWT